MRAPIRMNARNSLLVQLLVLRAFRRLGARLSITVRGRRLSLCRQSHFFLEERRSFTAVYVGSATSGPGSYVGVLHVGILWNWETVCDQNRTPASSRSGCFTIHRKVDPGRRNRCSEGHWFSFESSHAVLKQSALYIAPRMLTATKLRGHWPGRQNIHRSVFGVAENMTAEESRAKIIVLTAFSISLAVVSMIPWCKVAAQGISIQPSGPRNASHRDRNHGICPSRGEIIGGGCAQLLADVVSREGADTRKSNTPVVFPFGSIKGHIAACDLT